jgi:hypothetical protein
MKTGDRTTQFFGGNPENRKGRASRLIEHIEI